MRTAPEPTPSPRRHLLPNRRVIVRSLRYILSLGRPGPDLSWITDQLAVSGTVQPLHYPLLANIGIKSVVDLREEDKGDPQAMARQGMRFLHLPTRDHTSPTQSQLKEGSRWVVAEMRAGRKTLVHCKEGLGRSIAVICCAFIIRGHRLREAIRLVEARRWGVALNGHQMRGLRDFERQLRTGGSRQGLARFSPEAGLAHGVAANTLRRVGHRDKGGLV